MANCVFCQIRDRAIPSRIIAENDEVIVFLSRENHPLVCPKQHIPDVFSLDAATGAKIMAEAIRIARATKAGLQCDGIYFTQANGAAAGQDVFHYHLHIYPRWNDREERHLAEKAEVVCEKIRSQL